MKEFRYEAVDADGHPIHGLLEADDQDTLRTLLEQRGLEVISVTAVEIQAHSKDMSRVPLRLAELRVADTMQTAVVTQLPVGVVLQAAAREPVWSPAAALLPWVQLTSVILLAVTTLHALVLQQLTVPFQVSLVITLLVAGPCTLLMRRMEQRGGRILRRMERELQSGNVDLKSMASVLPDRLGEIARSDLPEEQKLLALADLMSGARTMYIRTRMFLDLLPPFFLLLISISLCYAFLALVVPGFKEIFEGFNLDLPLFTQMVISVSSSIQMLGTPGVVLIGVMAIGVLTGLYLIVHRGWLNASLRTVPMLGRGLQWAELSGISRWLAALLRCNTAPDEALRVAVRQSYCDDIQQDGARMAALIGGRYTPKSGMSTLSGLPLSLLLELVDEPEGGRRRSAVASMLDSLGLMFERAIFSTGRVIATVLQTIVVVFVGMIVGSTILALFLPLIQLINDLS